jgi:hypothetical protein
MKTFPNNPSNIVVVIKKLKRDGKSKPRKEH